jgi:ribosomal protein S12 methylthiotransferase
MKNKASRAAFISLGCAKNLVNTEQMMFLLQESGFEITGDTDGAEVVIVNTCSFIESAKQEAIDTIIELGAAKKKDRFTRLVVTGCLPERYRDEIMIEMPEVDAVVGTGRFDEIVSVVKADKKVKPALFGNLEGPVSETSRIITTSPVWAYLKIAEGCNNHCAYCAIPEIRGPFRSRPLRNIVDEAAQLSARGIKELIIVAQDVTRYGSDLYGKRMLADLLEATSEVDELKWIRLHYLYPDDVDEMLIDVIAENDKILKYLDIPMQHISDSILQRMNRRGTGGDLRALIKRLRERIPGVVLRTSIIAGLPGEGEREFEELCQFLTEARIERAGVFEYSPEEGTAAEKMERPDPDVAWSRKELIADIQARVMDNYNESRIGSVTQVLVEGTVDGHYFGRSFAESPDVDGYIGVRGDSIAVSEFVDVRITGVENGEPVGLIDL